MALVFLSGAASHLQACYVTWHLTGGAKADFM